MGTVNHEAPHEEAQITAVQENLKAASAVLERRSSLIRFGRDGMVLIGSLAAAWVGWSIGDVGAVLVILLVVAGSYLKFDSLVCDHRERIDAIRADLTSFQAKELEGEMPSLGGDQEWQDGAEAEMVVRGRQSRAMALPGAVGFALGAAAIVVALWATGNVDIPERYRQNNEVMTVEDTTENKARQFSYGVVQRPSIRELVQKWERERAAEETARQMVAQPGQIKLRSEEAARVEAARRAEEARLQAERQRQLAGQIESEQRRMQLQESSEYGAWLGAIQSKVTHHWVRPPSARPGLECEVRVSLMPGMQVVNAEILRCNGDAAVRRSIIAAIERSSPLPQPPNPALFERTITLIFHPEY